LIENQNKTLKNNRKKSIEDKNTSDTLAIWPKIVEYTGISEYEAKAYLSLLSLGSSGARKLSLHCNIPRTKIYITLKKLKECGLVEEIPGVPKAFSPTPPGCALSEALEMAKNKALDFSSIMETLSETHELVEEHRVIQRKFLFYLYEEDKIIGKCQDMLKQSEKTVYIRTTVDGLSLLFKLAPTLNKLQEKGVEILIRSPLNPGTNAFAREMAYLFDVKQVDVATHILFINSDNKRFLLATLNGRMDETSIKSAIFSDDVELTSLISLLLIE